MIKTKTVKQNNALFLELQSFIHSISASGGVVVSGEDGLRALSLAKKIEDIIENK